MKLCKKRGQTDFVGIAINLLEQIEESEPVEEVS